MITKIRRRLQNNKIIISYMYKTIAQKRPYTWSKIINNSNGCAHNNTESIQKLLKLEIYYDSKIYISNYHNLFDLYLFNLNYVYSLNRYYNSY